MPPTVQFPYRLRNGRFAQRETPRVVDWSTMWQDHTQQVTRGSPLGEELADIIKRLGNGDLIPESCYRNGIDRTPDQLLIDYGIKHLHLGGSDSNIILFLVEYQDLVLLLEINTHQAFAQSPVGSALRALHMNALNAGDAKSAAARLARAAAIKLGLRSRKRD